MDFKTFQTLSRDEQFKAAGSIAGVEPSVFDGIWRTESGRGANMLGPKLRDGTHAEGHFQLIPKTREAWEKRFGVKIDPYNFGHALFTAAATMKENMARWKNVPDALRAYNSGWEPANWNNPETLAYVGKVLGTDLGAAQVPASTAAAVAAPLPIPDGAKALVAQAAPPVGPRPATALWDEPVAGRQPRKAGAKDLSPVLAAVKASIGQDPIQAPPSPQYTVFNTFAGDRAKADDAEAKLKEDTSFYDLMYAGAHRGVVNTALRHVLREEYEADPNFVVPEDRLKGKNVEQITDLRATRSMREFERVMFDQAYAEEQGKTLFRKGILWGMGAGILADPGAAVIGFAGEAALATKGVSAMQLAAQGRKAAAFGMSAVEGVGTNVLTTAALDAMGEHQGVNDYLFSMVGGLIQPVIQGKAIGRSVTAANALAFERRVAAEAHAKTVALHEQAQKNLGEGATKEQIKAEVSRLEAEGIRADINAPSAAIPEHRRFNVGDEEDLIDDGVVRSAAEEVGTKVSPAAAERSRPVPAKVQRLSNEEDIDEAVIAAIESGTGARTVTLKDGSEVDLYLMETDYGEVAVVAVGPDGKVAGQLTSLSRTEAHNPDAYVEEGMRRRGLSTAMYDYAYEAGAKFKTTGRVLTEDGAAMNAAMKGRPWSSEYVQTASMLDEPWESAKHQARREELALTNPEWRKSIEVRTDGEYTPETLKDLPQGVTRTRSMEDMVAREPKFADAVRLVENLVAEYLPPNSKVLLTTGARMGENGAIVTVGDTHVIAVNISTAAKGSITLDHTTMHELGHAIFHQYAPLVGDKLIGDVNRAWSQFVADVKAGKNEAWNTRFAATSKERYNPNLKATEYNLSRDEWMAEQFVQHMHDRIMRGDFGNLQPTVVEQLTRAVKAVLDYAKGLVQKGLIGKSEAADAFYTSILRSAELQKKNQGVAAGAMANPVQASRAADTGDAVLVMQNDPVARKYGLDLLPMSTTAERAEAKQIIALYTRADAWAAANPLDEKRLNKILSRFSDFDPTSNQMLRSENPVVRMVATELLENGGGAGGRRSSAAIAKYMAERAIAGNSVNELTGAFDLWMAKHGHNRVSEFFTDQKKREFNKLVAEEIEQRRYPGNQVDLGEHVRAAADTMEAVFERARLMQVEAKTVGWGSLPDSSKGYMPHRMRSDAVRALTNSQRRALHNALVDQFVDGLGFDMSFADNLAAKYLDRVATRALGGFDAPIGLHQTGASDIIQEALEQMGMARDEVLATMKRYMKGGANHTKKRLNIDLRQTFTDDDGTTFRLLDLFDTNMLNLSRSQAQRVSGEVALAKYRIMGKPGLAILRRAMEQPGGKAKLNELEAFDTVAAEFLGQPFGTQSKWVDRATQANSLMNMGGMGFNQLGEIINPAFTLGVKAAASWVPSFGRLRSEILAKARGQRVANSWLDSAESLGGADFGTDAYKMVYPMDNPSSPINTLGADTVHYADKLLRGGGHLQSKLSFWRALHSTQQRHVAEQIMRRVARDLEVGGSVDFNMRDMGVSDDVMARLRRDAGSIIQRDGSGRANGFDLTKATDKEAAYELIQAVHRGTNQMIQGTFIGETGKYVHNSYLKMLAQFRGFGLTAIDKQWNRQKGNRGVARALGMTVAAMGAATPIYMLRTYINSIGREDQEEYLDKYLAWEHVAKATTNYIATSGLAGDFIDAFSAITGSELTGGRSGANTQFVGNMVAPALGKVDKLWGAIQDTKDGTDVHGLIKEMPLSRLPWLIPAINALGD